MTPRLPGLLAAAALALAPLAISPPAALAAPVFIDAGTTFDEEIWAHDDSGGTCTLSDEVEPADITTGLVENGPTVVHSGTASAKATGPVGDVMTGQSTGSGSISISSAGANPKSIDASGQATMTVTSLLATSACTFHTGAGVEAGVTFVVAQTGFLDIHLTRKGVADSGVDLDRQMPVSDGDESSEGEHLDIDQTTRVLLTPGTYSLALDLFAEVSTSVAVPTTTGSSAMHATFAVAGSQSAAAAGTGAGYVTLPSARSCATHSLTPTVTGKKKTAKKIKQIAFFVDGVKVKTVKHPKQGTAVSIPVADASDSKLSAVVTLQPKKKGKKGKELTVASSYVACTS